MRPMIGLPSRQQKFEKEYRAKAHEGKKLKGQQKLTSAVSTSKRLLQRIDNYTKEKNRLVEKVVESREKYSKAKKGHEKNKALQLLKNYEKQLSAIYRVLRDMGVDIRKSYDPKSSSLPPTRWYEAMVKGIKKSSDVRNPYAIVKSIWSKLSPSKRSEIRAREKKGERFRYDLPLPVDKPTKGIGTVRMVKPFKLAEVQVNLSVKDYLAARASGLFQRMKRHDGTMALVARCKSPQKNVNVFVDKAGK